MKIHGKEWKREDGIEIAEEIHTKQELLGCFSWTQPRTYSIEVLVFLSAECKNRETPSICKPFTMLFGVLAMNR